VLKITKLNGKHKKFLGELKMNKLKDLFILVALSLMIMSNGLMAAHHGEAEAHSGAIKVIHSGIPHDALFAIGMSGESGIAVGNFGLMLETSDGGISWALVEPLTKRALFGIARNETSELIVGQEGTVMTRKTGGDWTVTESGLTERLLNVGMNASGLAVTVGEFGFMAKSNDAGATWERLSVDWEQFNDEGYEPHLYSAIVKDDGTIMVSGEFGLIMKSTDGGNTFSSKHRGDKGVFDVQFSRDGDDVGYAVGQEGLVLKSVDDGETWETLNVDSTANLLGVWSGHGDVVITGIRELLRSGDDGKTFAGTKDVAIGRTWYQGIAAGVTESETTVGERKATMREQTVYIVGHQGSIAEVLQ
jgi:photosystem II stability/assembly factor-like uncharacterized protein